MHAGLALGIVPKAYHLLFYGLSFWLSLIKSMAAIGVASCMVSTKVGCCCVFAQASAQGVSC